MSGDGAKLLVLATEVTKGVTKTHHPRGLPKTSRKVCAFPKLYL
jgi:hypothetical protein